MKTIAKLASILFLALTSSTFLMAQARKSSDSSSSKTAQKAQESKPEKSSDKASAKDKDKDPLENVRFRNLGPAVGGGRVSAVVGIPGKTNVYYVGTGGGGVFLTQDGGLSWKPIFEKEATASIGAIALAPSNPNLVWVGTGEKNPRNDLVTGKGVYFSSDAGATWKFMGLRDAGQISNIEIDPRDPNTVFVAVLGHVWAPNADRGVFRTTDGGKTWQKVLFIDDQTGVSSLIMDPGNPEVLFAGAWRMRRYPWMLEDGGSSGGIFRSTDGGATWTKLTDGLPEGATGRIGLAAAASNPRHVYALVESKKGVLWDSVDLGDHWKMVSNNHNLAARGFYFSELQVSPKEENKIYFLSYNIMLSEDGGKTARPTSARVHVDHHAMWIDPQDPNRIINGNDGGAYVSSDAGKSWRYLDNLPIEQFYSVAADDEIPYTLCGGLQDNNGWCGPANNLGRGGISGADWYTVTGGDGEYAVPAGHGTHLVYVDSQNGSIQRLNVENGLSSFVRPYIQGVQSMKPADLKYRFNWTSPIAVSPNDPNEVYLGGNVLFHSTDGGTHWAPISPDLTHNDKSKQESSGGPIWLDLSGAETVGAILSISLSPVDPKTIWIGTDDGLAQVTRDGGQHWTNATETITGLPQWGRLQQIEASPSDANTAYVAVDFHEVDNNKPYAFKTHDGGKTWVSISQGLPQDDPVRVIREDPNRKGFLVAGTDTGLFYSSDDGAHWTALKSNFPTTPIYDIKFVKKTHDLVVASHGRGLFVLDDITPLEEKGADLAKGEFHLFPVPPAVNWHFWNRRSGFTQSGFVTPNPLSGAVITYYLPAEIKTETERPGSGRRGERTPVKITISDSTGQVVHTMYGPSKYGINRVSWNLRYDGPKRLNFLPQQERDQEEEMFFDANIGPTALPGTYKIAVTVNGKTETQSVEVETDPRFKLEPSALQAQFKLAMELRDEMSALNEALNRLNSLHKQITSLEEMLAGDENQEGQVNVAYKPVLEEARALDKKLTALQTPLYNNELQPGSQDNIHYLHRFHDHLQEVMRSMMGGFGEAPKEIQIEAAAAVHQELEAKLQQFNSFLNTEVAAFNKKATEHGSSTLFAGAPVQVKAGAGSAGAGDDEENQEEPQ